MLFIHTADWHLGSAMHNIDRTAEAAAFLDWLHDTIVRQGAEALIISGDVFDTANPPIWARRLYFHFLASLAGTSCCNAVVTGGNHDSGALLDAAGDVLSAINVRTVGTLSGRTIEDIVLPLHDKRGELIGVCMALPYIREAELRAWADEEASIDKHSDEGNDRGDVSGEGSGGADGSGAGDTNGGDNDGGGERDGGSNEGSEGGESDNGGSGGGGGGESGSNSKDNEEDSGGGFLQRTLSLLYARAAKAAQKMIAVSGKGERAEGKEQSVPIIATGHLFAAGLEGRYSGEDGREGGGVCDDGTRPIDVLGNLGRVMPSVFGTEADYVALGHIHYTSMVGGNPRIRYSGSPFVLGFDETQIERNVLLVDAKAGREPIVQKIPVPQAYRFVRLTGTVNDIIEEIASIQRPQKGQGETAADGRPMFVEIMHDGKDGQDARAALDGIIESAPFTVVSWRLLPSASGGVYVSGEGARTAKELSEEEVFRALIMAKNADIKEDSDEMQKLLDEYMPLFMEAANEVRIGV